MIGNIYPDSQWEKEKLGCFSSSEIHKLFTDASRPMTKEELTEAKANKSKKKTIVDPSLLSDGAITYINEKASELLTGTMRQFTSFSTDWGNDHEPMAVNELRKTFKNIEYFGNENKKFFKYGKFSGGSPDAINRLTVFEIKCPENPANHVENLLIKNSHKLKEIHKDYWFQIQMNMVCVAKERGVKFSEMCGVFVSYCPLMDKSLKLITVLPDMEFHTRLDYVLEKAENYLAEIINKLT